MVGPEEREGSTRPGRPDEVGQDVGLRFMPLVDFTFGVVSDDVEIAKGRVTYPCNGGHCGNDLFAEPFGEAVRVRGLLGVVLPDGGGLRVPVRSAGAREDE